jgi:hypothetical protein
MSQPAILITGASIGAEGVARAPYGRQFATQRFPARDPATMPWPLTRHELQAMAGTTLTPRSVEQFPDEEDPPKLRWRAEFTRA